VGQPEIRGFQTVHDGAPQIDFSHHPFPDRAAQYTYILSLPTLATYAIGNAVIKYQEGFVTIAGFGSEFRVIPLDLEQTHCARLLSYPKTVPVMEEGACTGDFPAHNDRVLRVGVGDVSDAPHPP